MLSVEKSASGGDEQNNSNQMPPPPQIDPISPTSQTSPISQTPPVIHKSGGLKSKLPWIIIILLLVIIAIFGGYVVLGQTQQNQTPTPSPTPTEAQDMTGSDKLSPGEPKYDPTADWKTFTSSKYGYSIKYDPKDLLSGGAPGVSIEEYPTITINDGQPSQDSQLLTIEALDGESYKSVPAIYNAYKLDLKSYVEEVRKIIENESNENPSIKLGPLEENSIDGQTAYKFTLSGAYKDHSGEFVLNEENTFVFTTGLTGMKFTIYYPTSNKHLETVFSTFTIKFTN